MSSDAERADMSPSPSTNWPYVINVANSIIGVSVLALPFCFKECGLVLGLLLLFGSAWLTKVTCHLLMKTALLTKRRSYEYLAHHIFGVAGKFTVEVSIIGMLFGTCVAFYIIIGDLGPAIVSRLSGVENTPNLRTFLLIAVTVFGSLPLGMLRSLERVSHFSALSLTFYGIFALHVFTSAFANFWSGVWVSKVVYWNLDGLFRSLPIIAIAFACQTQLFIVYEAVPEPSLKRMNSIVGTAVGLCSFVYAVVGCFGYIAFYDHEISGDVLMNFRPTLFSDLIKLGFISSTILSFPLVIFPCRASLYTLLFTHEAEESEEELHSLHRNISSSTYIPPLHFRLITVCIVLLSLVVGILIPNVEFMLSITGATMGSLICFILPAVMTMSVTTMSQGKQKFRAQFVLFVGVTILLASTYVTITTQERLVQQESVVKLAKPIEHHDVDSDGVQQVAADPHDVIVDHIKQAELEQLLDDKDIIDVIDSNLSLSKNSKPSATVRPVDTVEIVDDGKLKEDAAVAYDDKRKEPPNPREPIELPSDDASINRVLDDKPVVNLSHPREERAVPDKLVQQSSVIPDNIPADSVIKRVSEDKVVNISSPKQSKGRPPTGKLSPLLDQQLDANKRQVELEPTGQNDTVNNGQVHTGGTGKGQVLAGDTGQNRGKTGDTNKGQAQTGDTGKGQVPTGDTGQGQVPTGDTGQGQGQNGDDARGILVELRKQRDEQKKLLDEHRQIVQELRRHDLEVHHHDDDENAPGDAADGTLHRKPRPRIVAGLSKEPSAVTTPKNIPQPNIANGDKHKLIHNRTHDMNQRAATGQHAAVGHQAASSDVNQKPSDNIQPVIHKGGLLQPTRETVDKHINVQPAADEPVVVKDAGEPTGNLKPVIGDAEHLPADKPANGQSRSRDHKPHSNDSQMPAAKNIAIVSDQTPQPVVKVDQHLVDHRKPIVDDAGRLLAGNIIDEPLAGIQKPVDDSRQPAARIIAAQPVVIQPVVMDQQVAGNDQPVIESIDLQAPVDTDAAHRPRVNKQSIKNNQKDKLELKQPPQQTDSSDRRPAHEPVDVVVDKLHRPPADR